MTVQREDITNAQTHEVKDNSTIPPFTLTVNRDDQAAYIRHKAGVFTLGKSFIDAARGENVPAMGFENSLRVAASHELSHYYWNQLSETDKGRIIQSIKDLPQIQNYLQALAVHPGYRQMAEHWFKSHNMESWGIKVEINGETHTFDARFVIDELFANGAWRLTDLDSTVFNVSGSDDDENKRRVREIAKQASLALDELENIFRSKIEAKTNQMDIGEKQRNARVVLEFFDTSRRKILESTPRLITQLEEVVAKLKN